MSDIETIDLHLVWRWTLGSRTLLDALIQESAVVRDLQLQVASNCNRFNQILPGPARSVELGTEMEELRVDAEDVYNELKDGGPGSAHVKINDQGLAEVSSAVVGEALGADFEPDTEDLPPDEQKRYDDLRERGVGAWQAVILAGQGDSEAAMIEIHDAMIEDRSPDLGLDDHELRLLMPPYWNAPEDQDPRWTTVYERGYTISVLYNHGTLASDTAGRLHAEYYKDQLSGDADRWRPADVNHLGNALSEDKLLAEAFYGDLDVDEVSKLAINVAKSHDFDQDIIMPVMAQFGDGLAHASTTGVLDFTGDQLVHRSHDVNDLHPFSASAGTALLFNGTQEFDSAFLLGASQAALELTWGPGYGHEWEVHGGVGIRDTYLAKATMQGLGADLVKALAADGKLDLLVTPEQPFMGQDAATRRIDDPRVLDWGTIPPATQLLAQAGLDDEAGDLVIGHVVSLAEQNPNFGGQYWDPDAARGVGYVLIGAMKREGEANANSLIGDGGAAPADFFVAVAAVMRSGQGEELAVGSIGYLAQATENGGDVVAAADLAGQINAVRMTVGVEQASNIDANFATISTGVNGAALALSVGGAVFASTPVGWVAIGVSVLALTLRDPEASEGELAQQIAALSQSGDLIRTALAHGTLLELHESGEALEHVDDEGNVQEVRIVVDDFGSPSVVDRNGEPVDIDFSDYSNDEDGLNSLQRKDSDVGLASEMDTLPSEVDGVFDDRIQQAVTHNAEQ